MCVGGSRLEILLKNLVIAVDNETSSLSKSPTGSGDALTLLFSTDGIFLLSEQGNLNVAAHVVRRYTDL